MIRHFLVAGVLSVLTIQNAFGWGAVGHKTSAKVAWAYLDRATQAKVLETLGGGDLADASIWPDAARANPEWKFTIWYHFEKAPDNVTYLENKQRQDDKTRKLGGLLEALYVAEDVMKNPNATAEQKAIALKFLVHCIGDIHQPLHTGRVEDNSGNKVPVKWLGFDTNLHSVWDSQVIYMGRKDIMSQQESVFTDPNSDSTQRYADFLVDKYKDFKPTPETYGRYDEWMHQAMLPRTDAYNYKDESEESYTNRFIDTIDRQIFMAGIRIAWAVKRLVNQESPTEPLETLRRAIVTIVGDFTKYVSLNPRYPTNPPPPTKNR